MADIDLGFPEERASAWLTNRYFPSKVGGKPGWLDLSALPTQEQLSCSKCKQPKAFLCQIYAPYEDEHNFHRSIYVFVCRAIDCQVANEADNYTVLRSQLPVCNDFYSEQPPAEDGEPLPALPTKQKLCLSCGCLGLLSCGRCHKANYCSASHQRAHWPQHKPHCSAVAANQTPTDANDAPIPEIVFPEWEIVMEPDEQAESAAALDKKDEDDAAKEKERLVEFEQLAAAGQAGELQDVPDEELDKYAAASDTVDDKHFRKFKKEVAKEPEQILRYKRNGSPLWIADMDKTFSATSQQLQIPKCEACGSERQFEFQIMPQMLLLLNDEHLDWGVLAVFTCAKSCKPAGDVGYLQEFILKQDIVGDEEKK